MNEEEILKILSSYDLTEEEKDYLYLQLYFTNQLNSKSDEEILQMHKEQKKNRDSILNEIAKIMLSYSIVESIMSISKSDKLKLQSKINGLIDSKIQSELKYETIKTGHLLKYIGENKYNTNNYINNLNPENIKSDKLDKIINTKVDEKLWSDRLWANKNQTAADLRNEIKKFLNGETTVNQIEDIIKKKYNSNAFNTKRLVIDNIARVQEGINDVWRDDHNIERVLYLATLCHNTCGNCSQYDGKDYQADRKPVDLPQHNFCRCTYVNLPYEGWRPSERLDNKTKKRVSWKDYEEWYKNY
ncbi:phage head morphogenesis protein [Clostridium butyricum]|uniref:phage head morphogenesis protein n=1 Tax=Clostridium butyricum TaxID=1492 RepID=UPI00290788E2|nr:phage head morphogenesis protein [Clostridium butyricum]MDU5104791.1 phage head morphogenesis protein [Clostridium butyricum]